MKHPLHRLVGKTLQSSIPLDCEVVRDSACGGKQQVPLFCSKEKSRATQYCKVDMLILKCGKIRVIAEIEESDVKPTQVCGKFLASALASHYIHRTQQNTPRPMDKRVAFIQVIDASKLKLDKTSKIQQFENLSASIQALIARGTSRVSSYRLFAWSPSKSKTVMRELADHVLRQLA